MEKSNKLMNSLNEKMRHINQKHKNTATIARDAALDENGFLPFKNMHLYKFLRNSTQAYQHVFPSSFAKILNREEQASRDM